MITQALRDARKYEEIREAEIPAEDKPAFHLATRVGWMNDPNGFCIYQGKYHMFYQYHPYDAHWGPMHWGHAVSTDLLHWEHLPVAMAPDMPYDAKGCFSGTALTLPDGRHLLMYTGVSNEPQPDGMLKEIQTQCVAIGDGVDYEKYYKNPVLSAKDLPEDGSRFDFRDPRIWRHKDGTYRCIAATCDDTHDGRLLLFGSEDAINWTFRKELAVNNHRLGRMWECPDFFELDGKQLIFVSPQDMLPEGFEYHNGNGTVCLIGSYDEETETFTEERNQAIDYGIDFYAPQTILTEDGRRVMIGWMQNWDTATQHPKWQPWFGQMSLPRELFLRNGRLCQRPVRELDALHANKVEHRDVILSGTMSLPGVEGRRIDLELEVEPVDEKNLYHKFAVRFAQNDTYQTSVSFRPYESIVKIDRKFSGSRRAIIHQRRSEVASGHQGRLKLRIILDRFSAEIFVNDGERVLSATIYTDQAAKGVSFFADGVVKLSVVKYDIV